MAKKVLIAYASKCGSTGEVAKAIGEELCAAGFAADVRRVQEVKDVSGYDAVVIGSAARMGKLLGAAPRFGQRHSASLASLPTAYFTVCLAMKDDTPENRQTASGYLAPLCQVREPVSKGLFGGALDYAKLGPLFRFAFSKAEGMEEGDYRDWDAIRGWAAEVADAFHAA